MIWVLYQITRIYNNEHQFFLIIISCSSHCLINKLKILKSARCASHNFTQILISHGQLGIYALYSHELLAVTLNTVFTHSTAIQPKSHEQKWDPSGRGMHNPPNGQRLSSHINRRENCSSAPDPSKPSDQSYSVLQYQHNIKILFNSLRTYYIVNSKENLKWNVMHVT